ncbi:MAG: HAMP domain-containing sensor histidine kinase [Eubacteriales bacterium]|nr:HAMP domain-containing sensor histidine kinase [Eubacteriales bacterium]
MLPRRHLLFKFFASFLAMATLTVVLLWLIQAGLMRDSYLNQLIADVQMAVSEAAQTNSLDVAALSEKTGASILVLDASGNLVNTSTRMPMMGMALRHVQNMFQLDDFSASEIISGSDSTLRYALVGQSLSDGGAVFALLPLNAVDTAARVLRSQLSLITLALALAATVLALVLSRTLSRPILAATAAARKLAAGQYQTHLTVKGQDEIAELSNALNELGQQLQVTETLRRELIANVSHELRSPLTVIQGYAETVRDVTWPDEKKRSEQLTLIADEASRLTRVVGDILEYSKLQAGVRPPSSQVFAAGPVLMSVQLRFELEAAARGLTLDMTCTAGEIRFDPAQFEQVLTNLVANAINYADPDSVIRIRVEPAGAKSRFEISNQGETIPAEELQKIWDRYHRSGQVRDDRRLGTGLGLAIVRSILEQHDVSYGVESQDRQIRFWFETQPL